MPDETDRKSRLGALNNLRRLEEVAATLNNLEPKFDTTQPILRPLRVAVTGALELSYTLLEHFHGLQGSKPVNPQPRLPGAEEETEDGSEGPIAVPDAAEEPVTASEVAQSQDVVQAALRAAGVEVDQEAIAEWSNEQRVQARDWARHQSQSEGAETLPAPDFITASLDEEGIARDAMGVTDPPAEEEGKAVDYDQAEP